MLLYNNIMFFSEVDWRLLSLCLRESRHSKRRVRCWRTVNNWRPSLAESWASAHYLMEWLKLGVYTSLYSPYTSVATIVSFLLSLPQGALTESWTTCWASQTSLVVVSVFLFSKTSSECDFWYCLSLWLWCWSVYRSRASSCPVNHLPYTLSKGYLHNHC